MKNYIPDGVALDYVLVQEEADDSGLGFRLDAPDPYPVCRIIKKGPLTSASSHEGRLVMVRRGAGMQLVIDGKQYHMVREHELGPYVKEDE